MTSFVLDASAVIALLRREPGHETIEAALSRSLLSAVNLSEVAAKAIETGATFDQCRGMLANLSCTVVAFDHDLALRAGRLRAETRDAGLSLGDRACLALAEREGLPALTTDRSWARITTTIEIRFAR